MAPAIEAVKLLLSVRAGSENAPRFPRPRDGALQSGALALARLRGEKLPVFQPAVHAAGTISAACCSALPGQVACSIPDDHTDPGQSAFFMAELILWDSQER